ncbi:MAG TPA: CoA-binding protein [Streptosporangiaceae bacterium]|nr:CoA-binding protein [Streptosporangiaceae bacterium]
MAKGDEILQNAGSVLLVDWPSRDVPETLVRAGYQVFVKGGPGPDDYTAEELRGEEVLSRPLGRPPEHADLVYSYRPIEELPDVNAIARQVGATAVWHQSGKDSAGADDPRGCSLTWTDSQVARAIVESAGLTYIEGPYIADTVRRLDIHK